MKLFKSKRTRVLSLVLALVLSFSIFGISGNNAYASTARTITSTKYTCVYSGTSLRYVKIDPSLQIGVDIKFLDKNGKVVWSEANAISASDNYRVFYLGTNVASVWARSSYAKNQITWYASTKSQEGRH